MFGLMKYYRCASTDTDRLRYQLQYCGVCKALGVLYGQHTRFLLNRDLVFVSELLTDLSEDSPDASFQNASVFQPRACFQLPRKACEIPVPLKIAATYNVIMAWYKVEDNIADSGGTGFLWKLVRTGLSRAFARALDEAKTWDYPVALVEWWMEEQRRREACPIPSHDPEETLLFLAEPSAVATGTSMQYAAIAAEQPDLAARLYALGYVFGQIIYLLDAVEDFEQDQAQQQFNAVQAAHHLDNCHELPSECRQQVETLIFCLETTMNDALSSLSLPQKKVRHFTLRLNRNLKRSLGQEPCPHRKTCDTAGNVLKKMTLREKWRYAGEISRKIAFPPSQNSYISLIKARVSVLIFWGCLFLTPQKGLASIIEPFQEQQIHAPDCGVLVFLLSWLSLLAGMTFRRQRQVRLIEHSFDKLREEGVPEDVLERLEPLKHREYADDASFIAAIERVLGPELTTQYKWKFVQHAEHVKTRRARSADNDGVGNDTVCLPCCDCCNCVYCCDLSECCSCSDCGDAGSGGGAQSCDCGDGNCDCGDCNCGDCNCGDCACGDCHCGDCGCDACDCGGCDCGGCDC